MEYAIGIDLGGTNLVAGVVDAEYNVVARHSIPTNAAQGFAGLVEDMVATARAAAQKLGLELEDFASLGIGTPSCVNPKTRLLVHANNLGWRNVPLYDELAKHTPVKTYIQNDANCAALGEVLVGAAKGHDNAVMLTLGTGTGGGVILNRQIFTGGDGMGAELGHTVFQHGGIPCNCGKVGCLENYASATGLARMAEEAAKSQPQSTLAKLVEQDGANGRVVFAAAAQGDAAAQQVLEQYTNHVANAVASFVTIFRPDVFILGGGVAGAGEALLRPVNRKVPQYAFAAAEIGVPPVVCATLGNDAGIIGAAMLESHM